MGKKKINLHHLRCPSPKLSVLAILKEWCLIGLTIYISERFFSGPAVLIGIFFIATRMYALTELTHEAIHGNLFKAKRTHLFLEFLYSWPVFTDIRSYGPGHLRHHSRMNSLHDDPSTFWLKREGLFEENSRMRMLWILIIRPLLGYQALKELRDAKYFLSKYSSYKNLIFFWLLVFGMSWYLNLLPQLTLYWLIPFFWLESTFRFWKEVEDHYHTHSGIRTVTPSRIYAFFLNPYACGNHHIHHRDPKIPWHKMEAARKLMPAPSMDKSRHFFDTLSQILRRNENKLIWPKKVLDN